jgi:hypothetical protein
MVKNLTVQGGEAREAIELEIVFLQQQHDNVSTANK